MRFVCPGINLSFTNFVKCILTLFLRVIFVTCIKDENLGLFHVRMNSVSERFEFYIFMIEIPKH